MVCDCNEKRKIRASIIDIFVLVIALGVVLALFSLPIVFYYVSVSIIFIYLVTTLNRKQLLRDNKC